MQAGDKIKFIGDDRRWYFGDDYSKGHKPFITLATFRWLHFTLSSQS